MQKGSDVVREFILFKGVAFPVKKEDPVKNVVTNNSYEVIAGYRSKHSRISG